MLIALTRHELGANAEFIDSNSFILKDNPFSAEAIPLGRYELPRRTGEAHIYRLTPPWPGVLNQAKSRELAHARIEFHYDHNKGRFSYWSSSLAGGACYL
jgi:adenine-specific DNA-methyltransferase